MVIEHEQRVAGSDDDLVRAIADDVANLHQIGRSIAASGAGKLVAPELGPQSADGIQIGRLLSLDSDHIVVCVSVEIADRHVPDPVSGGKAP